MNLASQTTSPRPATPPTPPALMKHHRVDPANPPRGVVVWIDAAGQAWRRSWTSTWRDEGRKSRMKRFGAEGEVSARQAKALYQNWLVGEWKAKEHVRNPVGRVAKFTVADLCDAYLDHARGWYRKHGKPTSAMTEVVSAMNRLQDAYGAVPAVELSAPQIARLRDKMIYSPVGDEAGETRALRRNTVNGRLQIIKQAFTWAHAEKGLVSQATAWSIAQVQPLQAGRSEATEAEVIRPVSDDAILLTKLFAGSVVADMIELQRLTGMRPEEACIVRGCDVDKSGAVVWVYTPHRHKTEHHGKTRSICLGPKAQEIIRRRLKQDETAYLFRPADSIAEWNAKSESEQSVDRGGEHYTTRGYRQAIHRACTRAFPFPGLKSPKELKKLSTKERAAYHRAKAQWDQGHAWNPNQLRHAWATEVRKKFGLEASAIGLGHSDLRTAEIYAERDQAKAAEVARLVG